MARPTTVRVRQRIVVRGAVQGVGFRPFVYREATALGLAGWVRNSAAGVTIEAEGDAAHIARLLATIRSSHPPHAHIVAVALDAIAPQCERAFTIQPSCSDGGSGAQVLPDLATCEQCVAELFDPTNRRYRYPFSSCTNCGPRYSIVEAVPYDRANTSMRQFDMCAACRVEYDDPADRRFHAEPNACAECGPRLSLWDPSGGVLACDDAALMAAANAIQCGRIVAVKGIGGFHLLADARNEAVVCLLRERKRREEKPFAVMFPTLAQVGGHCMLDGAAASLLMSAARPIVLLRRGAAALAPSVAPDNPRLGALLPYTPLHHLLMRELGFPVVATSGNLSEEPIVIDALQALDRLAGVADLFLVHDRPIVRPVDDSVAQIVRGRPQLLRRGRGHAPAPVPVDGIAPGILALGGHLKATVALSRAGDVVLSQHIGDLATGAAREAHRKALGALVRLHDVRPRLAVHDAHPDYASSRAADKLALPSVAVQHHVAHVAACLAEHDLAPPALGVAWDGMGYGMDGTVWGGEFLLLAKAGWRRVASLRPFRLPGGEAAVREPRRAALGLLYAAFGERCCAMTELAPIAAFDSAELAVLRTVLARGVNAPLASSMGRFFDAVASLCGLRQRSSYEGQAAMSLEWACDGVASDRAYTFPLEPATGDAAPWLINWQGAIEAVCADCRDRVDVGAISQAVHRGLARAIVAVAERIGERRVVLTGGCFQNAHLTEAAVAALDAAGFEPLWHQSIPPNDGGIAVGQVAWASWTADQGDAACV